MFLFVGFHPGKCFRLYTEDEQLPAENLPQILESNITATVLFLKRLEIAGLAHCNFMDQPGEYGSSGMRLFLLHTMVQEGFGFGLNKLLLCADFNE